MQTKPPPANPKSPFLKAFKWFTGMVAALAAFMTVYDTLRNKGRLFVCDGLEVVGQTNLFSACEDRIPAEDRISALKDPSAVQTLDDGEKERLRAVRIIEGKADRLEHRVFDVTLENPTHLQVTIDRFELHWRYLSGVLSSISHAAHLSPHFGKCQ